MLRITTDQKRGKTTLGVEGRLAGLWVRTLEECWRDLRAASPRSKLQIDLCGVSYIDDAGKLLLAEIHRQGGNLVAQGCLNQAIIEEIVEAAEAGKHARRREARTKSGPIIFWLLLASLLGPALGVHPQEKRGVSSTAGIPTYNYQVSARMPLFTGGHIHAEIVRADLEIQELEQQRADERNQVALDVKTALVNLEPARNDVQVANLGVTLAREEVSRARDRFQAGVANNIEVINAQDSLPRANDNQIAALYRFNQARADRARSLGEIEKLYGK